MYTNQATDAAQGLLAQLSTSTFRMTTLIVGNFRTAKLKRVNNVRVQRVNTHSDIQSVFSTPGMGKEPSQASQTGSIALHRYSFIWSHSDKALENQCLPKASGYVSCHMPYI